MLRFSLLLLTIIIIIIIFFCVKFDLVGGICWLFCMFVSIYEYVYVCECVKERNPVDKMIREGTSDRKRERQMPQLLQS